MGIISGAIGRDKELLDDITVHLNSAVEQFKYGELLSIKKPGAYLGGLSKGESASAAEDNQQCLTVYADSHLHHRDELISKLGSDYLRMSSPSDAELILASFSQWGKDCLQHLEGDFAFAIWDHKNQSLFCARDHLGIRPFYFSIHKNTLVFSSNPTSLLTIPGSSKLDNEVFLSEILAIPFHEPSKTIYQKIQILLPGHCLEFRNDRVRTDQYWKLENTKSLDTHDDEECYQEALRLLKNSIKNNLDDDSKFGAHLSGGIDSTTVAILAARRLHNQGKKLIGYSWSPLDLDSGDIKSSEIERIRNVGETENIDCEFCSYPAEGFFKDIIHYVGLDSEHLIREMATQSGVNVMLSGWGGDQVISQNGAMYLIELFHNWSWIELSRQISQSKRGYKASTHQILHYYLPGWMITRPKVKALYRQTELLGLNHSEVHQIVQSLIADIKRSRGARSVRAKQLHLVENYFIQRRIEEWNVQGMRSGIQYRFPLLDKRLVEYCISLPGRLYSFNGGKRSLIKQTISRDIPNFSIFTKKEPVLNKLRKTRTRAPWDYEISIQGIHNRLFLQR